MRHAPALFLLFLAACKSRGGEASAADAAPAIPSDAGRAVPTDVAPAARLDADAGASTTPSVDAAAPRPEGELVLEVRGGYCPADKQALPGCRSYTYALRADGTLRGGTRRSVVPAETTEAIFRQAADAFTAKHTCIPNAPDRGSQTVTLRRADSSEVARGGCGAAFDAVKARLEKLASEP